MLNVCAILSFQKALGFSLTCTAAGKWCGSLVAVTEAVMRSSILVSFVLGVLSWLVYPIALLMLYYPLCTDAYEVVYAVNCGGSRHIDRYGIQYRADDNLVGIPSTFGLSLSIARVHPDDMVLYQTERYHTSSFSYNIPIEEDGDYILVTKFSEVYFQHPGGKVGGLSIVPL
jgi:hypothetical protein